MLGLGATELLIILALVLVLFGAGKLPQLGRGLGEGISNFKRGLKASNDADATAATPPRTLPESTTDNASNSTSQS